MKWCKIFKTWSIDNWNKVLFTDESSFELFSTKQRIIVRRRPNEKYRLQRVAPTVKHGGSAIMFWGSIWSQEVGPLTQYDGIVNDAKYSESKNWAYDVQILGKL